MYSRCCFKFAEFALVVDLIPSVFVRDLCTLVGNRASAGLIGRNCYQKGKKKYSRWDLFCNCLAKYK